MILQQISDSRPFTAVSPELLKKMTEELELPDKGQNVKTLADNSMGGAFNPRDLEKIPAETSGYQTRWAVVRYEYYGFEWDITGLCLQSLDTGAGDLPWIVIINGGSANFYEFFLDPLNAPGLGQYLAQKMNVMLVTIPGNFKYGGWDDSPVDRKPQYLLDKEMSPGEVRVRNAIYTNKMLLAGVKRLIRQYTRGDVLITGHSTSGELTFLSQGDKELASHLKGRVLGWGTGGPSNIRKEWEEKVGIRKQCIQKVSAYPPLWQLRSRHAEGYVSSGYIGPLNPCKTAEMEAVDTAARWLELVGRRRPNFKQVLQDVEHGGMIELKSKMEKEIREVLSATRISVNEEEVIKDLFATNQSPLTGYRKIVWVVGKWDQGHWNREIPEKARELTIATEFRKRNPEADIRILLLDMPLTHYGHIEKPRELAGALIAAGRWLAD
jgi:hypothetical protein